MAAACACSRWAPTCERSALALYPSVCGAEAALTSSMKPCGSCADWSEVSSVSMLVDAAGSEAGVTMGADEDTASLVVS